MIDDNFDNQTYLLSLRKELELNLHDLYLFHCQMSPGVFLPVTYLMDVGFTIRALLLFFFRFSQYIINGL